MNAEDGDGLDEGEEERRERERETGGGRGRETESLGEREAGRRGRGLTAWDIETENGVEMVARASSLRISGKLFGKGGGKGRMTV